jgi:hypothetical protein
MRNRVAIASLMAVLGVLLGLIGARYVFVNSGLSLVPWGLVSLGIGARAPSRSAAVGAAGLFGFALAVSFMAFSYDGNDGVGSVIIPFCLLGLVGAACAMALALVGRWLRSATSR